MRSPRRRSAGPAPAPVIPGANQAIKPATILHADQRESMPSLVLAGATECGDEREDSIDQSEGAVEGDGRRQADPRQRQEENAEDDCYRTPQSDRPPIANQCLHRSTSPNGGWDEAPIDQRDEFQRAVRLLRVLPNRLRYSRALMICCLPGEKVGRSPLGRKEHAYGGPFARLALDPQLATMGCDDLVGDREAESHALPKGLRGEKGLEKPGQELSGMPLPASQISMKALPPAVLPVEIRINRAWPSGSNAWAAFITRFNTTWPIRPASASTIGDGACETSSRTGGRNPIGCHADREIDRLVECDRFAFAAPQRKGAEVRDDIADPVCALERVVIASRRDASEIRPPRLSAMYCRFDERKASGLLISWATPAASVPREASRWD